MVTWAMTARIEPERRGAHRTPGEPGADVVRGLGEPAAAEDQAIVERAHRQSVEAAR